MESVESLVRALCKSGMYMLYYAHIQRMVSYEILIGVHLVYITLSTIVDGMRWARFKVDEESKIQMVHHVATWTLLGVMLSNGYWV